MAIIRRDNPAATLARSRGWDPFEAMEELLRWDPFRELSRGSPAGDAVAFMPRFEVKETKQAYVFKADLPGVKETDLDISLTGNRLTISGSRTEEQTEEGDTYYARERTYGSFSRAFTLPDGIDGSQVQAELKGGVLTVAVPKMPEVQPRRITLKGAEKPDKASA
jgi:HSP20 family protein